MPLYDQVKTLEEKKDKHVELLQSIRDIGTKIGSLESQYNSFAPRERGLLTRLIPRQARETVVVNDLTDLAGIHGLTVTGVDFEESEETTQNIQTIGEQDAALGSRFEKWNVVVNVQGGYDGFKAFLTDLGRSIRIADVSHISVRQSTTGTLSLTEYQVMITIYSLE